jgi:hypothetical protein
MRRQYILTSRAVQERAAALLQQHLGLHDHSTRCTAAVLLHVLFAAAARLVSVFAACKRLRDAPSDQTIRNALCATLPDYAELQRRVQRALTGDLPKALRRRRQRLAIDLTLIPYHGQPLADPSELYRGQPKSGTSRFHAYASAYVVLHGQRFTVALTPVPGGEALAEVVRRLLRQAARAGVRPALLLLDRGFYAAEVFRYLQRARVPFLLPAYARGRKRKPGQPATGIRAFQLWKRGGWGEHTLNAAGPKRARVRVRICVYCGEHRGRRQRPRHRAWVYAAWGLPPRPPRWVAQTYRLRFGIETSYRQMNQARIRTCARSPVLRFLFVAIALILRNVWVWYHWEVLSTPRRGRRLLRLERLRFQMMLQWLNQMAEAVLGIADDVPTERPAKPKVKAA